MTKHVSDLVAVHIQSARRDQGLTGQQLAAKCAAIGAHHLTAAVIANIETGRRDASGVRRRDVTIDELCAIALALQLSAVDLLGSHDDFSTVQITSDVEAAPSDMATWMAGGSTVIIPSLLGGIALCGACQVVVIAVKKSGVTTYLCVNPTCPGPRIDRAAASIDAYVTGRTLGYLSDVDFTDAVRDYSNSEIDSLDRQTQDLIGRRTEAQRQLENLAAYPQLTAGALARSLASFDRKLQQLEATRKELKQRVLLKHNRGITQDQWGKLPLNIRRSIIEICYTVILVSLLEGEYARERTTGEVFEPEDIEIRENELDTSSEGEAD